MTARFKIVCEGKKKPQEQQPIEVSLGMSKPNGEILHINMCGIRVAYVSDGILYRKYVMSGNRGVLRNRGIRFDDTGQIRLGASG
jgi:hypothetical protein